MTYGQAVPVFPVKNDTMQFEYLNNCGYEE